MLSNFRAHYHKHHIHEDNVYEKQYQRLVMLRNVAIVGEKIVKVAQSHVREKLKEAVKEATSRLPPEVLEDESRLYSALEMIDEVDVWTRARGHMEVSLKNVENRYLSTVFLFMSK